MGRSKRRRNHRQFIFSQPAGGAVWGGPSHTVESVHVEVRTVTTKMWKDFHSNALALHSQNDVFVGYLEC